ncbi:hypothetical protein F5B22DRAFT_649980 [Xylaria bambusicola]|uniref:uncharacterized protein n=1 Tax=Xylaria bambusicola TaxID=326684 RepID=UPI002008D001|nr:uncharacterized protein F5B22DRAFT_649980 [Xylaria bambusicola]KAI0508487.1 hypothetical protein F5B22DRAFT_649980 [Xylaria bambusicola]
MVKKARAALLGMSMLAPGALASPGMRPRQFVTQDETVQPTMMPAAVNPATLTRGEYVVTLVNSHTADITTAHNQNLGAPTAIQDGGSIVESGSTAIFAVPTGWAGRVAMAEAGVLIRDRASLLEGSFIHDEGLGAARIALDVSYVDGFTVPIVCQCNDKVVVGCNLDLLDMCPADYRINYGTCINPHRDEMNIGTNFFHECAAMAYTFPTDDRATVWGVEGCEASIKCCVGTACAPHPRQVLCPNEYGVAELCVSLSPDNSTSPDAGRN